MGFKPQGVSIPGAFSRTNSGGNSNFKQRPTDRLCTITGYDVAHNTIIVTEDISGNVLEAKVGDAHIQRNRAREQTNPSAQPQRWVGYDIDARMEEHLPVGEKVVLERCITTKKLNVGGQEKRLVECTRVIHITAPSPEKTFHGVFTISAFQGRISNVQSWADRAISSDDQEALSTIASELDDNKAAYENKENRPNLGVQFRVIVPKELEAGKEEKDREWEVIDSSPPFDWVQQEKDAAGNVVRPGHPLDGAKFGELINGYFEYVFGAEDGSVAPKFSEDVLATAKVEVMTYVSYLASSMSTSMQIPDREWDPLYELSHTRTKYAQDDTEFTVGKNWAVRGILSLSEDKAPKTKTESWTKRDLAVRLFANALRMNVHRFVATSEGNRVRPHPAIERVRDEPTQEAGAAAEQSQAPAARGSLATPPSQPAARPAASAPSLSAPAADPFGGGASDPFLDSMAAAPAAASTAAPLATPETDAFDEAPAVPAAEPAAQPAAAPAAAQTARKPFAGRRSV